MPTRKGVLVSTCGLMALPDNYRLTECARYYGFFFSPFRIECDIMVPISFDEPDRTVTSNFVGGIRDVHGLLDIADPGVHTATIRYDCEGGVQAAHWQLEYVGAKKP